MNLNPFIYSYKHYPNSMLATMVSKFCGGMQRMFILLAVLILLIVFDDVSNWGEALCGAVVLFLLWLLLKFNKDKWSDKIAAKQEAIDNSNEAEGK